MKYFDVLSVQVCQDTGRWLLWSVSTVLEDDARRAQAEIVRLNDAKGEFMSVGRRVKLHAVNVGPAGVFHNFVGKSADETAREALDRRRDG